MTTRRLVGRESELSALRALVDGAPDRGGAIALLGEAGIGKSTLLRATVDHARARGYEVLETSGVEPEAHLPFAALHQLVRPVLATVGSIPPVQRRALSSAFGVDDDVRPEPFLVALAMLNILTEVASHRPLLVAIDDLHWLDQPSHDALGFVARRVARDPIAVVGTLRTGHASAFTDLRVERVELGALDDRAAREVLDGAGKGLTQEQHERVLRAARGNPLALVELPSAWCADGDAAADPGSSLMRLTDRLERAFAGRLTELSGVARDTVLVAAIDEVDDVAEILAGASVLAGRSLGVDALEPASRAGLLHVDTSRVAFRHPLVRSAVVQSETVGRRQAAHDALARALHDPYRRAWHAAQAITGPDDDVADELDGMHVVALRRGGVLAAVWALERSAGLTSDPAVRGRRLLLAARLAFDLGRGEMVDRLLAAAARTPLSALDEARMEWLREVFHDGVPGDPRRVLELCDIARRSAGAGDVDLALDLLLGAALRCWWADTGPAARARVVEVIDELGDVEDDPRAVAARAVAEPISQGRTVFDALSRVVVERVADPDALRLLGMAAHAVGDQVRAAELLERAETMLRDQGRLGLLSHVLGMHSSVRIDLGDLARAAATAEEGTGLAAETGQPIWSTGTLVCEARAAGLRGDVTRALELAAEAEHAAGRARLNDFLACVQLARGFAYASAGRHEDAYAALRRLFDPGDPSYHERERFAAVMFLAESAVQAGARDDARKIVADLEAVGEVTPSPLLHVQLLYARAVLADDADADALYLGALGEDLTRWPWVRARLELAYGTWLRRRRRVGESRAPLRAARATLDVLGARAWAEHARTELRAAGERGEVRGSPADLLSPQELQIARLAAQGLSNREIGQRLYLSHRTVGSHLYRIFPKLDVTSRAQLASRLGVGHGVGHGAGTHSS